MPKLHCILLTVFIGTIIFIYHVSSAQAQEPYVRMAKIVVDSMQIENPKANCPTLPLSIYVIRQT
jgi:hypothetical protein